LYTVVNNFALKYLDLSVAKDDRSDEMAKLQP